jgi:homoserine kinase type II
MGVKRTITSDELPQAYQHLPLIPTRHGVMASVYLLGSAYVVKLFERETPLETIEAEVSLLNALQNLPTPKVVEQFQIENHEVVIFTQIEGEMHLEPTIQDVQEIGRFLKLFHAQSKEIEVKRESLFSKERLWRLVNSTGSKRLKKEYFFTVELTLHNDGVIHGDLFPDNCKFMEQRLSGVYDFSDACMGDFHFELAVVAMAWCFDGNRLNHQRLDALLDAYQPTRSIENFSIYLRYALLYYATTRFIAGRDHEELLERLGF